MNAGALLQAAQEVENLGRRMRWPFCFIGGMVVARWGEPRATNDVDLCIFTGFGGEDPVVAELLRAFEPRRSDAVEFAARYRVLLLKTTQGVGCDISLGAISFEEEMVSRATRAVFAPGIELTTCSAEDLLVAKAFAGRPRDWIDVEGIIVKGGKKLDWRYIQHWMEELCAAVEAPENLDLLMRMKKKLAI